VLPKFNIVALPVRLTEYLPTDGVVRFHPCSKFSTICALSWQQGREHVDAVVIGCGFVDHVSRWLFEIDRPVRKTCLITVSRNSYIQAATIIKKWRDAGEKLHKNWDDGGFGHPDTVLFKLSFGRK
jgi:hypothetical protein